MAEIVRRVPGEQLSQYAGRTFLVVGTWPRRPHLVAALFGKRDAVFPQRAAAHAGLAPDHEADGSQWHFLDKSFQPGALPVTADQPPTLDPVGTRRLTADGVHY